jgi:NhaP-type Na+/H+ or K+/H+ antiporter
VGSVDVTAVVIVMLAVFAWGALSSRLERADLTAPVVFMAVGALLGWWDLVDVPDAPENAKVLVEITLVWVLFSDAARVRIHDAQEDVARYLRLLGVSLPLTMLLGWAVAAWLVPELDIWAALLVAAALAPTDAALGVPVVTNNAVPARVRRLITVESGLNDGVATPVVLLAIAGVASAEGLAGAPGLGEALLELAVGVVAGAAVGFAGGWLLRWARRRAWAAEEFVGVAVLALAVLSYATALAVHGNGFVAAFCGGLAFGAAAGPRAPGELAFLEQASGLVSLLVWLAFGVVVVPLVVAGLTWPILVFTALSLTVIRMVPVGVALLGSGTSLRTMAFVGWFGPRGLASLVFALLALEELGSDADTPVVMIAVTVGVSVLVHGFTAEPLAERYGRAMAAHSPEHRTQAKEMPLRGLPRRGAGTDAGRPRGGTSASGP